MELSTRQCLFLFVATPPVNVTKSPPPSPTPTMREGIIKTNMTKIIFNDVEYDLLGTDIYKDGVKINTEPITPISSLDEITALKIDNHIYYDGSYYSKVG